MNGRSSLRLLALLLLPLLMLSCGKGEEPNPYPPSSQGDAPSAAPQLSSDGSARDPNAAPTPDPNPAPTPDPDPARVSVLAAGDVIIHEAVYREALSRGGGSYDFLPLFSGVADTIAAADISFVNFECPIAGDSFGASGYPHFNAPSAAGDAIVALGFDVVNIANNHMLDMDGTTTGLANTLSYWKSKPVLTIGGYTRGDYDELRIVERGGMKIAFLSYTYGTNEGSINSKSPDLLIPTMEESTMLRQLKAAREGADAVIVSLHWGEETTVAYNVTRATSEQKRLARLLAENGADVILGHHPHALQQVERITAGDGREALCYYSLGNFISTQYPYTNLIGGFASFALARGEDGSVRVEEPRLIPHITYYTKNRDGLQVMLLSDFTPQLAELHGTQLRTSENGKDHITYEDFLAVPKTLVSAEFLE